MDITQTDITILMVSTVLVILMAITFPAIGLVEGGDINDTQELYDRFPELDIQTDRFDLAGDFPSPTADTSSTESQQIIEARESDSYSLHRILEDELYLFYQAYNQSTTLSGLYGGRSKDYDEGIIFMFQHSPTADSPVQIGSETAFTFFQVPATEGALSRSKMETNEEGQTGNWTIEVRTTGVDTENNVNITTFEYDILGTPETQDTSSYLSRATGYSIGNIPFLGPIIDGFSEVGDAASGFANVVFLKPLQYIVDVFIWFMLTVSELILNIVGGLFDGTAYLFGFVTVLVSVMIGVISTLPAPVALFYILPVFGLFTVLAKFLIIGVQSLPLT